VKRKESIPYPMLAPGPEEIPDWTAFNLWAAIRYRGRDNLRRAWRKQGLVLPPRSDEWDPPIPEPQTSEPRPRVNIKSLKIPEDMSFAKYRLSDERYDEYEAMAVALQAEGGPEEGGSDPGAEGQSQGPAE
jgi:hypothetical protein